MEMLLFLSIAGLFLSLILLYFNARNYKSSVFLGLFFICISIYSLFQYVFLLSGSFTLVHIFLYLIPFYGFTAYLIGPLLFWYIRSVLRDDFRLKPVDFLHLLPAVLFFTAALAVFFKPGQQMIESARAISRDSMAMLHYKPSVLSDLFSFPALFLSRPVLVIVYILASTGLLLRYRIRNRKKKVFPRQQFMTSWIPLLLGFSLLLSVMHLLVLVDYTLPESGHVMAFELLQLISAMGLTGLLISPFFFPTILYGLPQIPVTPVSEHKPEFRPDIRIGKGVSVAAHFEAEYLQDIGLRAERCMEEIKPYLQGDCNLAAFSKLIHVPAHHLAYYFREERRQSFNDYRNAWRVKHAKKLIAEGKANELTLEAIGHLSGFSSRNSFFTCFKKEEGISPGVFAATI